MRIRTPYTQELDLFNTWRVEHGSPALPVEIFPPTGAVCVRDDDSPIAVAWLYLSNASFAYVAWPVTKPGLKPRLAHEALTLVLTQLIGLARQLKISRVLSTSSSRGLTRLLQSCGMILAGDKHDMLYLKPEGGKL